MSQTTIRDCRLKKAVEAEVFWFNCQVCGKPLVGSLARSIGFCSGVCLEADRTARRAAKKAKLRRLLRVPA